MSYVRAVQAALPGDARAGRGADRQRLVHRRQAAVDRHAALLGDESRGAVPVPPGRGRLCQGTDSLQRSHAGTDGDGRLVGRRRAGRPAGVEVGEESRGGARIGRRRPPARPARGAGGDRGCHLLPVLGPCQLCDGIGLERRRRNRPDHHPNVAKTMPELAGTVADAFPGARTRARGVVAVAARRRALTAHAGARARTKSVGCARRSSAIATGSCIRRPSAASKARRRSSSIPMATTFGHG